MTKFEFGPFNDDDKKIVLECRNSEGIRKLMY